MRVLFLLTIAIAFLACGEDGVDTEVAPADWHDGYRVCVCGMKTHQKWIEMI